jgi:putative ATPase
MNQPLPERLRPQRLEDMVGQEALLGSDGPIRLWLAAGRLPSLILYGPPGSGKTTLGRLLAEALGAAFLTLNASSEGLPDLRRRLDEADKLRTESGHVPLLFLDEIHRFSKTQQDALLGAVEAGRIVLVGATVETPWGGAVIGPLLSRMSVVKLAPLDDPALETVLERGLAELRTSGVFEIETDARRNLLGLAAGDGRRLLGILEAAVGLMRGQGQTSLGVQTVLRAAGSTTIGYDRSGAVSAMIKSIRGGDEEAALYWLAVQLEAGEDGRYVARRLLISAAEEVGAADPAALPMAAATLDAVEKVGMPEAHYPLAATVSYLARTARDWWPGQALSAARARIAADGPLPIPGHLRPSAKTYRHPAHQPPDAPEQAYRPADLAKGALGPRPNLPMTEMRPKSSS